MLSRFRRRPAAIAIAVAASLFVLSVAVPALGGPSPLRLAKRALKLGRTVKKQTRVFEATRHDVATPIPNSSTTTTVATLSNLPRGSYVITAQVTMLTQAGDGNSRCELTAGGEKSVARTVQQGSSIETLTAVVAHTYPGVGTASVACANNNADWSTSSAAGEDAIKIIAERAPGLRSTAVGG
jgi:hypothetical protein